MAAEFHRKTSALFEEFKKRELCYLNTESKTSGSFSWKNDFTTPAENYLEKINKREKETETTYKDLMKHLEDLDRRTDQMSLKLEKLSALRSIAISNHTVTWPSIEKTFDQPLQPYYTSNVLHSTPTTTMLPNDSKNALHSLSEYNISFSKVNSQSVSTQTEYIFCDHCHNPLHMYSKQNISNVMKSSINLNESMKCKINEHLKSAAETVLPSKHIALSELNTEESCMDDTYIIKENFNYLLSQEHLNDSNSVPSKTEIHSNNNVAENNQTSPKASSNKEDHEQSEVNQVDSEPIITAMKKKQSLEMDDNTLSNIEILEEGIAKSDDESMYHEFDFLESDKRSSKKIGDSQLTSEVLQIQTNVSEINSNVEKRNSTTDMPKNTLGPKEISVSSELFNPEHLKQHTTEVSKKTFTDDVRIKDSIQIVDDLRLDSSVSVGLPSPSLHSENASLASESDSFSEKETPLTATAAYQALLGNVSVAKTLQNRHPVTDSDSEDEIENALASAVRKSSSVMFDTGILNQKSDGRKESVIETKSKPETKASNTVSKPQNKLSKNTRKVLGLDTSSGSEIELPIKSDAKQTNEDSDEFDFYD